MRKSEAALRKAAVELELNTKAERVWFAIAFALLVVYAELVAAAQHVLNYGLLVSLLAAEIIAVPVACWYGVKGCRKLRRLRLIGEKRTDKKRTVLFTALVFAAVLLYSLMWQLGFWPGSLSPDSAWQYEQAVTGVYNNWHPVIQTLWTYSLPLLFFQGFAPVVTVQLVWWSLSVAYLFSVLYRMGCSKWLIGLSLAYLLGNPNNMMIMMNPWKDSALTIFALFLFTQLLQIYNEKGAWLKKWYNFAAFTACAFMTAWVRHNGVLLVLPVFVVLLVFLKSSRRVAAASAAVFLGLTALLFGPVYSLMDVEKPGNRVVETMGLPMTVLSNVYAEDPGALEGDALRFMESLGTVEDFQNHYHTGSFNSIKFWLGDSKKERIEQEGAPNILKYTLKAFVQSPKAALEAAAGLTRLVWSIDIGGGWGNYCVMIPNDYGIVSETKSPAAQHFGLELRAKTIETPAKYLFNFPGVVILFLLLLAVGSVGNGGLGRAFLVLAPLAYDFGTMLLLSGEDFRFFQFNFVIVIPLFVLMISRGGEEPEGPPPLS